MNRRFDLKPDDYILAAWVLKDEAGKDKWMGVIILRPGETRYQGHSWFNTTQQGGRVAVTGGSGRKFKAGFPLEAMIEIFNDMAAEVLQAHGGGLNHYHVNGPPSRLFQLLGFGGSKALPIEESP